jgi:hypothetical protein
MGPWRRRPARLRMLWRRRASRPRTTRGPAIIRARSNASCVSPLRPMECGHTPQLSLYPTRSRRSCCVLSARVGRAQGRSGSTRRERLALCAQRRSQRSSAHGRLNRPKPAADDSRSGTRTMWRSRYCFEAEGGVMPALPRTLASRPQQASAQRQWRRSLASKAARRGFRFAAEVNGARPTGGQSGRAGVRQG